MDNSRGNIRRLLNVENIPRYIASITKIDYDVDDIINTNRLSKPSRGRGVQDDDIYSYLYDGIPTEYENIPYFSRNYASRKADLNVFCSHPEVEFIIHSIAYDTIVYDENNFFLSTKFDPSLKQPVREKLEGRFKTIYQALGFNDGTFAWEKMVEFLKIGFLAFEIIYDNPYSPKEVIGFEELNPEELVPFYKYVEIPDNGVIMKKKVKMWKQICGTGRESIERILPDNSVVFISYNKVAGNGSKFAYSERLIRSFNLKRTIENCKVAWQVMNSQFRLKIVVPVGTRNSDKAKQALAAINNKYKEDVTINNLSGEVTMNSQPLVNFGKTITLPSRNGQTPEIGSVSFEGPNLSETDSIKHFERNFWRDSNMPFSRFDKDNGGGTTVIYSDEGITNDDRFYFNFINTIRREFEQIIKKPLSNQAYLDYPQLKKDRLFKTKLGFIYNSDSLYQQAKEEQQEDHKIERIKKLMQLGSEVTDESIFDIEYLIVHKYNLLSTEEWKLAARKIKKTPPKPSGGEGDGLDGDGVDGLGDGEGNDNPVLEPGTDDFTPPDTETAEA